MTACPDMIRILRPAPLLVALFVVVLLPLTVQAQDRTWQAEAQIDQELDAFEDPTLLRVLTLDPEPDPRLRRGQPFKQQPLFSQQDFRPPIAGGPIAITCVPTPSKPCR